MLNKVMVMGRMTRDVELRYTSNNTPVATFGIACDRDYKGSNGEKQTDFFSCVAWRGTAEFIQKYFSKGRMIVVDGRLQQRQWEDNEGNKRSVVEIVVDNAYFGDSKRDDEKEPVVPPANQGFSDMDNDDGELPFD